MIVRPSNMQRVAAELSDVSAAPRPPPSIRNVAALEAATFAQVLAFNLLAMTSADLEPEKRQDAAERAFTAWPALARRMSELETLCPQSSASGYATAERLREIAERGVT